MKTITVIIISLLIGFLFLASCSEKEGSSTTAAKPLPVTNKMSPEAQLKLGEYLVMTSGCDDCHSPKVMTPQGPVPDMERRLSGHPANEQLPKITDKRMIAPGQWVMFNSGLTAAVGPWGTSFSANLTPDTSGIGEWSFEQFEKAIREGKYKGLDGGRMLLPPMPWPNYSHFNDQDLRAIFAFLKSLKPIQNVVPQPIPPVQ